MYDEEMIATDFASNESGRDALVALKLLLTPYRWKRGSALEEVRMAIGDMFSLDATSVSFFLSGRAAIHAVLRALLLPDKAEIIVTGFTCEAVVLPILALGLKPIYVDIEADTYALKTAEIRKHISAKTKVLMLQHTFGMSPKFRSELLSLAKQHKLIVIEDLAHGFDTSLMASDRSGSIKILSFGRSKALSSVYGGAVITNDKDLSQRIGAYASSLSYPSWRFIKQVLLYKIFGVVVKATYDWYLGKALHALLKVFHVLPPEINRTEKYGTYDPWLERAYPNALAVLLQSQLQHAGAVASQRKKNIDLYQNAFGVSLTSDPVARFPLLVESPKDVLKAAAKQHVYLGNWYVQPVAPKELVLSKVHYKTGSCPVAERVCKHIINLPTTISQRDAQRIIDIVKNTTTVL